MKWKIYLIIGFVFFIALVAAVYYSNNKSQNENNFVDLINNLNPLKEKGTTVNGTASGSLVIYQNNFSNVNISLAKLTGLGYTAVNINAFIYEVGDIIKFGANDTSPSVQIINTYKYILSSDKNITQYADKIYLIDSDEENLQCHLNPFRKDKCVKPLYDFTDICYINCVFNQINNNTLEVVFQQQNTFASLGYTIIDPTIRFSSRNVIGISGVALKNDTFALAWCDQTSTNRGLLTYLTNGTQVSGTLLVGSLMGGGRCEYDNHPAITALNETTVALAVYNSSNFDLTTAIFYPYSSLITNLSAVSVVDGNAGNSSSIGFAVNTCAFDSDLYLVAWYNNSGMNLKVYNRTTNTTGIIPIASVGSNANSISCSAFNSSSVIVAWKDVINGDMIGKVYNRSGNNLTNFISIDLSNGVNFEVIDVAVLNETAFGVAYTDGFGFGGSPLKYSLWSSNGTQLVSDVTIHTDVLGLGGNKSVSMTRINSTAFGIGFYENVVDGLDADTDNYFSIVSDDGTELTDSFNVNGNVLFSEEIISGQFNPLMEICKDRLIYAYSKSTSNASWSSFYLNGTEWNGICTTCAYTTGNWNIDCVDSCVISSDVDLNGNNISMTGIGTLTINSGIKVSNWTYRYAERQCYYQAFGNGGFYN